MIRKWKPWKYSTGPKTKTGKEACKMNAYKHGARGAEMLELRHLLREHDDMLAELHERI